MAFMPQSESADESLMSIVGTSLAQSLAGAGAAERVQTRERRRAEETSHQPTRQRPEVVVELESAEPVHGLAGSRDEDSRQDHQRHPAYAQALPKVDRPPTIDLEA
jgi:uncharacterized membrane protein YccC